MTVVALISLAVTGCADDKSSNAESSSPAAASSNSESSAAPTSETDDPSGGVRIPIGETKTVVVPADAVLDIKVPAAWGAAASGLRCSVLDGAGRNEDLRSSDVKKTQQIYGHDWMTLWTFSAPPNTELTVGCKDPNSKIPADNQNPYIRVIPRGLLPH
ncbi:hypothetical protein [Nocardia arthritidis]|uniref:Uncharacterized protein n=1 Tax=Nocardia arthritidis TaxID=228602 RepID=A0A6G9YNX6_9NOCA|nr:hypothetical protein [Nocardia arthritidis]QIS14999.1 hypothetical protein F5544_35845 [Nocardia arthritidis]